MIYLHHAVLFTPDQVIPDGFMLIQDGRVTALGAEGSLNPPQAAQVIDADGLIAAPGFIDIQINGAYGMDFTETPETMFTVGASLPATGVTAFLPTIITCPREQIENALRTWEQGPPPGFQGAVPLGLHLEGPMISPQKKGAHQVEYMRLPSMDVIQGWSPERGVRLVTLAPELPGAQAVVLELCRRGVIVSAGHTTATYEQAMQAFSYGIRSGTHLFNAMPALHHRSPGFTGALLEHPSVYAGLISDGIHVHPAIVDLAWKAKGPDKLILVTDAMAALGMEPGNYNLAGKIVTVDQTSARLPDGTLAGSLLTIDAAVRNLVTFTGCSLAQAAACASRNPARLLGLETKGRLSPGMDADLVLLSPQGEVKATLVNGRVCFSELPELEVQS